MELCNTILDTMDWFLADLHRFLCFFFIFDAKFVSPEFWPVFLQIFQPYFLFHNQNFLFLLWRNIVLLHNFFGYFKILYTLFYMICNGMLVKRFWFYHKKRVYQILSRLFMVAYDWSLWETACHTLLDIVHWVNICGTGTLPYQYC